MRIILHRHGTVDWFETQYKTLLTPGTGTDRPPFYLTLHQTSPHYRGKGGGTMPSWIGEVSYQDVRHRLPPQPLTSFPSLAHLRQEAECLLTRLLGEPVEIAPEIELYCHPPHPGDIEFPRARYEEATDTIRSVPENYCLISFTPAGPSFDVDAATHPDADAANGIPPQCAWRTVCRAAHGYYLHPVNHPGTPQGKRWLAWLISEYRKYGLDT